MTSMFFFVAHFCVVYQYKHLLHIWQIVFLVSLLLLSRNPYFSWLCRDYVTAARIFCSLRLWRLTVFCNLGELGTSSHSRWAVVVEVFANHREIGNGRRGRVRASFANRRMAWVWQKVFFCICGICCSVKQFSRPQKLTVL